MSGGRVLGETNNQIKILVAEDDNFQRLALIDILELCNYGVTAVENGKIAKDELMNEDSNYDLVLLDLMMPEMDGLELLTFMKQTEKLKDIPVIIMSSDGEMESVATCMSNGAKDYLIKPIRIQNVRGLATHVNPAQKKKKDETKSLAQYVPIRLLGKGSAGSVHLVKSTADNELYALKTIELRLMSPHERKLAENEVTLLKVLNGPTIIRYYESFTENETIYIVMEFAEGGSLTDRIAQHKARGEPIPNEQILDWTAQLVIGIMLMHSKNILHRDIKSQNMFLVKGDIVKLGDFGISKALGTQGNFAKTYCGTPYFMSPEVCRGEAYGQKSDIWALGCALYELAALKKPFDHTNIPGLIKMICENDFDPLPDYLDTRIKVLIYSMLQKDPSKRPSIWEIAQVDYIKERIEKFVTEHNCRESVEGIIDFKKSSGLKELKENGLATGEKIPAPESSGFPFPMNKLDEFSGTIRDTIKLRTVKTGFFSKEEKVVTGEDLVNWFKVHINFDNLEMITKVCNNMLNEGLIYSPSRLLTFRSDATSLYRFQMDRPRIPVNLYKKFKEQARPAPQVTADLVAKMNEVIKEIRVETTPGVGEISAEKIDASKHFNEYMKMICELQTIQLNTLDQNDIIACFLNIYQIMYIHSKIIEKKNANQPVGLLERIKRFFRRDNYELTYHISQMDFTLEDIKHGILRGNKKSPNAYYFRNFSDKEPRNNIVKCNDPRLVLLFIEDDNIPKKLETYYGKDLEGKLDKYCKELLASTVIHDPNENELIIPNIFKIYKDDFGDQTKLIDFILKYNKFTSNPNEVVNLIKAGKFLISYADE